MCVRERGIYFLDLVFLAIVVGEGNGTPLWYSCLEDPMDGGAWWAAVHGVTKSRTRLKRISSSSILNFIRLRACVLICSVMSDSL